VVIWGLELLFAGIYLFGGVGVLVYAIRRNKPFVLVLNGILLMTAGWISHSKGTRLSYALLAMSVLLLAIGIYEIVRRSSGMPRTQS
jgi:hypothetical protein